MFQRDSSNRRRLDHADEMVRLLTTVVREGTGKRAAIDGFVAGKTGTSQEHRDGWFLGFTDNLVVGVWVGNDDNSPTKEVTGGGLPAEIWREFVTKATGIAPVDAAPEGEDVPDGPPVAEGADAERDVAEEAAPMSEEDVAAAEQPAEGASVEDPAAEAAEAPPPEEAVVESETTEETPVAAAAAEETPAEAEVAAEQPASAEAPVEAAAAEAAPAAEPVAVEAAPQVEAVAEAPQEAPRLITDPDQIRAALSRNRAVAEDYVTRKRSGRREGPQILLGGAGLQ
jgi:membrane peptidoglycan carboxypeptidase